MSKPVAMNPIAHVVSASDDCEWMFDRRRRPREGNEDRLAVRSGAIVRVLDGELTLEFVNGVRLKLAGPTMFGAESTMRGRSLAKASAARPLAQGRTVLH